MPASQCVALMYPSSIHGSPERRERDLATLRARLPDVEVVECFDRSLSELAAEDDPRLAAIDVAVVLGDPAELIGTVPRLAWVQSVTTGVDHVDLAGLAAAGVRLATASGTSSPEIAEFVVARILEHWKRLPEIAAAQTARQWAPLYGRPLSGSTVLLVGFGAINQAVARLLAPFGIRLTAVRRSHSVHEPELHPELHEVITYGELEAGMRSADAVVVAVPASAETDGLFDARKFEQMRPGSFFCNVGRGSTVVEPALIDAVARGHLGGAALDVVATEPLPAGDPIWQSGVRISPHCSSAPDAAIARVLELLVDNIERHRDGGLLRNEVALPGRRAGRAAT